MADSSSLSLVLTQHYTTIYSYKATPSLLSINNLQLSRLFDQV